MAPAPLCEYGRQKVAVENYLLSGGRTPWCCDLSKVLTSDCREPHLLRQWVAGCGKTARWSVSPPSPFRPRRPRILRWR